MSAKKLIKQPRVVGATPLWHDAKTSIPDDDRTVQTHSESDPDVWLGYFTANEWRSVEGFIIPDHKMKHWADISAAPTQ